MLFSSCTDYLGITGSYIQPSVPPVTTDWNTFLAFFYDVHYVQSYRLQFQKNHLHFEIRCFLPSKHLPLRLLLHTHQQCPFLFQGPITVTFSISGLCPMSFRSFLRIPLATKQIQTEEETALCFHEKTKQTASLFVPIIKHVSFDFHLDPFFLRDGGWMELSRCILFFKNQFPWCTDRLHTITFDELEHPFASEHIIKHLVIQCGVPKQTIHDHNYSIDFHIQPSVPVKPIILQQHIVIRNTIRSLLGIVFFCRQHYWKPTIACRLFEILVDARVFQSVQWLYPWFQSMLTCFSSKKLYQLSIDFFFQPMFFRSQETEWLVSSAFPKKKKSKNRHSVSIW